ncbi:MAG: DUF1273 family protein [Clostridia bacterium]|nr:DUF1273 family protein [Clostridia bacterium]
MKETAVCVVGQINIDEANKMEIKSYLAEEVLHLIIEGHYSFLIGDNTGFQRLVLETLIQMKTVFSQIEITSYESIGGAAKKKSESDEKEFQRLKEMVNYCCSVHETRKAKIPYTTKSMIDNSCLCLCYYDTDIENSDRDTVLEYAIKKGHSIINISDKIRTHKENMLNTSSDPCKSEAYHYECDYTSYEPEESVTDNKLKDFYKKIGATPIEDPFDSSPKRVIPEDKETFYKLRDLLNVYVLMHHGKMSATVDCEKWYAKIEVFLSFVEFTSIEELVLLRYISEKVQNMTISPTDDGKVRMYIQINYFENI